MSFEAAVHTKAIQLSNASLDMCATAGSGHPTSAMSLGHLVTVLLVTVLSFTVLHAMLQIDFDWRYRVPIIPCLLMLAAIAGNEITYRKRP